MGMSIDDAIKYYSNKNVVLTEEEALANTVAINTMRKYQQLQADYENRLKADMAAMLEELSMKIGEIEDGYVEFDEENKRCLTMTPLESIERLIDREINSLKEA